MTAPDDPAKGSEQPLSAETLESLRQLGGDDFLAELATLFLSDAPSHLASIDAALAAGDSIGLARSAHALKSSAANMGAARLQHLLAELEGVGRASRLEDAAGQVIEMKAEYARVARALEALRDR